MEKKQPDATVTPMSPGQTHLPRFNTWPEEARPLKQPDWIWYFERTADILLVLVPLYFIRQYLPVLPRNRSVANISKFSVLRLLRSMENQ